MERNKKPPKPQKVNAGQEIGEYLFGSESGSYQGVTDPRIMQGLIGAERTYRPEFAALELGDIETLLLGRGNQSGLLDLMEQSTQRGGQLLRSERELDAEANYNLINEYGLGTGQSLREADPYSSRIADLQQRQAENLYNESEGMLSQERARMAEQAARKSSIAMGRDGDSSNIARELLGRESVRSQLRGEARTAGNLSYNMNRGLFGNSLPLLLGSSNQSARFGSGLLGSSLQGAMGVSGPQMFDPNAGVNIGMQHQQNMNSYNNAVAQQRNTGIGQALGMAGGAALGTFVFPGIGTQAGAMMGAGIGGAIGGGVY